MIHINSYDQWMSAIQCSNVLDVLLSLATYSMTSEGEMSRPEVLLPRDGQPIIQIKNGRHPCSVRTFGGEDFIPNDTDLGCSMVRLFTIVYLFCIRPPFHIFSSLGFIHSVFTGYIYIY